MSSISIRKKSRKGLEALINRYSWDIFGTGTFAYSVSKNETIKKTRNFFQSCESRLRSPIPRFWVIEPHKRIDSYHIHFLLASVKNINENVPQILFNKWRKISGRGRFRTDKYDTSRDSGSYLTKYLLKDTSYYETENLDKIDIRYQHYGALDLKHAIRTLKEEGSGETFDIGLWSRRVGEQQKENQKSNKEKIEEHYKYLKKDWRGYLEN